MARSYGQGRIKYKMMLERQAEASSQGCVEVKGRSLAFLLLATEALHLS